MIEATSDVGWYFNFYNWVKVCVIVCEKFTRLSESEFCIDENGIVTIKQKN